MINKQLEKYINENIFPLYQENDLGHNIVHIKEVIRRCFVLNKTFELNLDENMIFVMASYHDLGKHIDHEHHHLIAGKMFFEDDVYRNFLVEMRDLLKQPEKFKEMYCKINRITSRTNKVCEEPGRIDLVDCDNKFILKN